MKKILILFVERNNMETIEEKLKKMIGKRLQEKPYNIDIFELLEELFLPLREEIITNLLPYLLDIDPNFFEDPNPILLQKYPIVDRGPSKISGKITTEDLMMRTPYSSEIEKIKSAKVVYAGFGGFQLSAMILARAGVINFYLIDFDRFESSNANRQAFCFENTLGKYKVDVGREYIKKINSEANVRTFKEKITEDNAEKLLSEGNVVIEATGDPESRFLVQRVCKKYKIPMMIGAWAGYEGQYLTLMPEDPYYYEIFDYSPYTPERGFHPIGMALLNAYVANDALKIIMGDFDHIVRYPKLLAIDVRRTQPFQIRDIRYIRRRLEMR